MPLRLLFLLASALALSLYLMYLNASPIQVTLYPGVTQTASVSVFALGAYCLGVVSVFLLYFYDTLVQALDSMKEAAYERKMARARALIESGRDKIAVQSWREAEKLFNKALALAPDSVPAMIALGDLKRDGGELAEAVSLHSRALAVDPESASAGLSLAEDFIRQDSIDPALNILRDVRQAAGRSLPPLVRMRDIYAGTGSYTDALEVQKEIVSLVSGERAVKERGLTAYFHMRIAEGHFLRNEFGDAVDGYQAAIRVDENCEQAYIKLAFVLTRIGREGESVAALRKGFTATRSPVIFKSLVSALIQSGDMKSAEKEISQAMSSNPDEPTLNLLLAGVHIRSGDYPSARRALEKVGDSLSGSVLYNLTEAKIRRGENNVDWALMALDKAYIAASESMFASDGDVE
ncbi:MAG: tetratricopeptide repeat protein [Nitrospinae bacterium]|nr:tetratricopeptide repeat protein [Nitrospinota bacterium]